VANPIQAIRGMNDVLPLETTLWQQVETTLCKLLHGYGYQEIRLPILEKTELFKRTIGEATDIVEKEMYTFLDRNEDSLALRPEGTAGCVRAGVEHGLLHNQIQKFWYKGPYFRHERPQKGRYRQFHQCGAEVFGIATPDIDAELILMTAHLFEKLGLKSHVTLQINSLGSIESRTAYRQELVNYLTTHQAELDEDSQRRLTTNPLRILDSKNPAMQTLIQHAPKLMDFLDVDSKAHFETLQQFLKSAGLQFAINPCLVRGLDYYNKTVFEWITHELGAQGTVCAGGRYDGLVEQLGGKGTPGLGFAIGMERLILLIQETQVISPPASVDIYLITDNDSHFEKGLAISAALRNAFPELCIYQHCGGGSLKNQFKKADKSGAKFAIIIGEQEYAEQAVAIKSLRQDIPQQTTAWNSVVDFFKPLF
jgi:histidyl-tRNA synthetase